MRNYSLSRIFRIASLFRFPVLETQSGFYAQAFVRQIDLLKLQLEFLLLGFSAAEPL